MFLPANRLHRRGWGDLRAHRSKLSTQRWNPSTYLYKLLDFNQRPTITLLFALCINLSTFISGILRSNYFRAARVTPLSTKRSILIIYLSCDPNLKWACGFFSLRSFDQWTLSYQIVYLSTWCITARKSILTHVSRYFLVGCRHGWEHLSRCLLHKTCQCWRQGPCSLIHFSNINVFQSTIASQALFDIGELSKVREMLTALLFSFVLKRRSLWNELTLLEKQVTKWIYTWSPPFPVPFLSLSLFMC